jgi:hypothetical protein
MSWFRSLVLGIAILSPLFSGPAVKAMDDDHAPVSVTISFGAGLNTAGPANHHILPQVIKVRATPAVGSTPAVPGVVNFVAGGFHQIFVYNPGVTPDDITTYLAIHDPTNAQLFINDLENLFYTGVNPARVVGGVLVPGGNDSIPPVNLVRSGVQNRTESVGFSVPGTYLVICNVRPHFQDGMMALVKVVADNDDD